MKTHDKIAKVTLVGAGPGDIELITLKGINALKEAKVILYDALVNEELLDLAPSAVKIFVGKRKGFKAFSQEEINQLIVEKAFVYGHVVRLKGGDSFVFGRGYEEIEYVKSFGIPVNVVPGLSSSISVPALAGIPVTHRGTSNSFFVLTAVLADGSLNKEIEVAAQSSATVVVLMGLSKLAEIAEIYTAKGRSEEAIAVITNGSLPSQTSVVGTIRSINAIVKDQTISGPGLIVIGPVVELLKDGHENDYLLKLINN